MQLCIVLPHSGQRTSPSNVQQSRSIPVISIGMRAPSVDCRGLWNIFRIVSINDTVFLMDPVFSENRRARFDYEILETFEAGLVLNGSEVKSIKTGKANIAGSFAVIRGNEAFLLGADIPPYQPKNTPAGYDPTRTRKLLLTAKEIKYLAGKARADKLTLVPLKLYNKRGLVKLELALARGKKKSDKRETIKKREVKREIERTLKR